MDAREFDRHLVRELCWLDGSPTHASHAGQRQCRHCRRKWSYANMRKQWELARFFCAGHRRGAAAALAGVDPHVAGRHYRIFEDALAGHFMAEQLARRGSGGPLSPSSDVRQSLARARDRRLLRACVAELTSELPAARRLELLFRLVFADRVRRFGVRAIEARAGSFRRPASVGNRGSESSSPRKAQNWRK